MNAALDLTTTSVETLGGYYGGRVLSNDQPFALIVAPKALGERKNVAWNRSLKSIAGALSWNDGLANTQAMAEGGSELAQWALGLTIHGHSDYYIASQDEKEILYRKLKPTAEPNSQWARSGINLSALPPTRPYTEGSPGQTEIEIFQSGGSEAFEAEAYWTSTQRAANSGYAWTQHFFNGYQDYWYKTIKLRARVVRRLAI